MQKDTNVDVSLCVRGFINPNHFPVHPGSVLGHTASERRQASGEIRRAV